MDDAHNDGDEPMRVHCLFDVDLCDGKYTAYVREASDIEAAGFTAVREEDAESAPVSVFCVWRIWRGKREASLSSFAVWRLAVGLCRLGEYFRVRLLDVQDHAGDLEIRACARWDGYGGIGGVRRGLRSEEIEQIVESFVRACSRVLSDVAQADVGFWRTARNCQFVVTPQSSGRSGVSGDQSQEMAAWADCEASS
jgi:hypothetical protein